MVSTVQQPLEDYVLGKPLPRILPESLSMSQWARILEVAVTRYLSIERLTELYSIKQIMNAREGVERKFDQGTLAAAMQLEKIKDAAQVIECVSFPYISDDHTEWPTKLRKAKWDMTERVPVPVVERIVLLHRLKGGTCNILLLTVTWVRKVEWDDSRSVPRIAQWWAEMESVNIQTFHRFEDLLKVREVKMDGPLLCRNILRKLLGAQRNTAEVMQSRSRADHAKARSLERMLERVGL